MRWIATCARGLEEIVAAELTALGLTPARSEIGGVPFDGGWEAGLRANWRLRAANRVLIELATWPASTDEALYAGARAAIENAGATDSRAQSDGHAESDSPAGAAATESGSPPPLSELFSPNRTLAIDATTSSSNIRDTRWIALKTKDAIVDAQRALFGTRSNVERADPDLQLRLRLHRDRATLLVDTTGEPLDRRGYRVTSTAAPLRENLAAACILATGWNGVGPVVDPMCGSGTLLAEAGAIALGLAPNRLREKWAFERLPGFEVGLWERIRAAPIPAPDPDVRLIGIDTAGEARVSSERNLAAAGLAPRFTFVPGDAFELEPPAGPGLVAVNPPHGERMLDSPESWKRLGDLLKRRYGGWKAVVFAGGESRGKHLGLRPSRRIATWNGPLGARILVFDLW